MLENFIMRVQRADEDHNAIFSHLTQPQNFLRLLVLLDRDPQRLLVLASALPAWSRVLLKCGKLDADSVGS